LAALKEKGLGLAAGVLPDEGAAGVEEGKLKEVFAGSGFFSAAGAGAGVAAEGALKLKAAGFGWAAGIAVEGVGAVGVVAAVGLAKLNGDGAAPFVTGTGVLAAFGTLKGEGEDAAGAGVVAGLSLVS